MRWLVMAVFVRQVLAMVAATKKTKAPAKKASTADKSLIGTRTKSGLVFGYAAHLARIRPGVDLTKPTYVLGK
jgi:hypothetical protein